MTIGQICANKDQFIKAEGLFNTCEGLLKHSICFERVHFNNLFAALYEKLGNRNTEMENKIETGNKITKFLPYWSPRMVNLMIPEFK